MCCSLGPFPPVRRIHRRPACLPACQPASLPPTASACPPARLLCARRCLGACMAGQPVTAIDVCVGVSMCARHGFNVHGRLACLLPRQLVASLAPSPSSLPSRPVADSAALSLTTRRPACGKPPGPRVVCV
ncbi:hypothetical protein ACJQWK_05450 [Exserohilum turcicum]